MATTQRRDRNRPGDDWTSVADLVATLRRRWQKGPYLRAHVTGVGFEPISLPVRAPTATDLTERLDEVRAWVEHFDNNNRTGSSRQVFDLEHKILRTRTIGDTPVPVRAHVPSFERLCAILGTQAELTSLQRVLEVTRSWSTTDPSRDRIVGWVSDNPRVAIEHEGVWNEVLAVIGWMADTAHDRSALDIRHLDAPGIDTKFVDRHRKLLGRLLEQIVPADQIDRSAASFAGRFGFRERSTYVRFRLLDPVPELPSVLSEAELRVDELARLPLSISAAFIVENRASYLAFPHVPGAIAIFGEGFGVTVLEGIPWLACRELVYWGDIDTHGFAILDRLRQRVPDVRSILMDRTTLLDHLDHVVLEQRPTDAILDALTNSEQALYRDLVQDRYGHSVRLEQERIRFSAVRRALEPWMRGEGSR